MALQEIGNYGDASNSISKSRDISNSRDDSNRRDASNRRDSSKSNSSKHLKGCLYFAMQREQRNVQNSITAATSKQKEYSRNGSSNRDTRNRR